MKTALLLSGGMDSTALAYWKRPAAAITIDYGQVPAPAELRAAASVCDALGIEHHVLHADLRELGSGDMAGGGALVIAPVPEWWPFRNQMLITLAAMKAVSLDVRCLMIGTLSTDARHADGRPEFIAAMDRVLSDQEGNLRVSAPAIGMTAMELVRASEAPMEILSWAHSCHVAEYACGLCRGCRKHYETLAALGADPY